MVMEFHLAIVWRRVVDALKPIAKRLLELLGGEEERQPVPVRVEREVPRHECQQRSSFVFQPMGDRTIRSS